jgi:serine/threonine-protein kinase ULK/ATG1
MMIEKWVSNYRLGKSIGRGQYG